MSADTTSTNTSTIMRAIVRGENAPELPKELASSHYILSVWFKTDKAEGKKPDDAHVIAPLITLPEAITGDLREVLMATLVRAQDRKFRTAITGGLTSINDGFLSQDATVAWALASARSESKLDSSAIQTWYEASGIAATVAAETIAKAIAGEEWDGEGEMPAALAERIASQTKAAAAKYGKLAAPVPALSLAVVQAMNARIASHPAEGATAVGRYVSNKLAKLLAAASNSDNEGL